MDSCCVPGHCLIERSNPRRLAGEMLLHASPATSDRSETWVIHESPTTAPACPTLSPLFPDGYTKHHCLVSASTLPTGLSKSGPSDLLHSHRKTSTTPQRLPLPLHDQKTARLLTGTRQDGSDPNPVAGSVLTSAGHVVRIPPLLFAMHYAPAYYCCRAFLSTSCRITNTPDF
jgi:hypothetical protein